MRAALILIIVLIVQFPSMAWAEQPESNPWEKLSDLSYKALQLTKAEKYKEAKDILTYFEDQYLQLKGNEQNLSMHNLRVFSTSYDESLKMLTSASASHEERVDAVTEFHLLVDAIYSHHQPLWKTTRNQVMVPLKHMREAAVNHEIQQFYAYFNQFLSQYEKIHPALSVDLPQDLLGRLDSYITYLDENRSLIATTDHQLQQISSIQRGLEDAFNSTEKDESDPSLFWLIVTIGGVIITTLIYVGWRKYNGEKREIRPLSKQKEYNRFR